MRESVNKDTQDILFSYYGYSSPQELRFDWGLPLLIAVISFLLLGLVSKNTVIMNTLVDINSASLNVMAILAGFNTASLAVIASTNQETLRKLFSVGGNATTVKKEEVEQNRLRKILGKIIFGKEILDFENSSEGNNHNILKQVLTFFSYAIVIQLIILVLGSIFVVLNKNSQQIYTVIGFINTTWAKVIISCLGAIWFTIILHSLLVSIRNVSLLYRYILYLAKQSKQES
ncbi:hypothetical protein [Brevibacillus formosus]|nr:hypothetical protein [Brevibacillus formosus]MED1960744.1 hypothetical protein [Brevibacillus formosus]GED61529.1 hypothetical protein BFO01nite_56610 [Brevibacillus formosus]